WKTASEMSNYRRFFDVAELVSLRMELPEVFEATHEYLFALWQAGRVTGLRVDHPDGLRDPQEYFTRLQRKVARAPDAPGRLYIVAEKILSPGESLPADWPVAGTTGYDFLNRVNGLFVNNANAGAFDELYGAFVESAVDFPERVYEGRRTVLEKSF